MKQRNVQRKSKIKLTYIYVSILLLLLTLGFSFKGSILYFVYAEAKETGIVSLENPTVNKEDYTIYGIDVSTYQSKIDWEKLKEIKPGTPIRFIFIRATAGKRYDDRRFKKNWKAAKEAGIVRGAYHYFRPNEKSTKQADNFVGRVKLEPGDLPPVVDIEVEPTKQSINDMKRGLKTFIKLIENHYGVKPIIYTSSGFYKSYLKNDFKEYKFWLAKYNFTKPPKEGSWIFWQYTDKGTIQGIEGNVDLNVFYGNEKQFQKLLIK